MGRFNKDRGSRDSGRRSDRRSSRRDSGSSFREFERNPSRSSDRRFSRGRSDELEMHPIICDTCGKRSEVPFKPTSGKPILCRDCFDKGGSRGGSTQLQETLIK